MDTFVVIIVGPNLAERALYVVDGNGIIRWSYISPIGVNPGAEGILKALETMNSKQDEYRERKEEKRKKEG